MTHHPGPLVFVRFYLDCLSHASYLVGDRTTGRAVVVDPGATSTTTSPPPSATA